FHDHLVSAGEILFDLLELAMLGDDFLEFSVLLGQLLETRGIGDDFRSGEFLSHFLVTGVELIEFFAKSKYRHKKTFLGQNLGSRTRRDGCWVARESRIGGAGARGGRKKCGS